MCITLESINMAVLLVHEQATWFDIVYQLDWESSSGIIVVFKSAIQQVFVQVFANIQIFKTFIQQQYMCNM